MALFAVIDNTIATRIVRVELDATASTSVTAIFQQQRQYFESHHNNMIPFYAGYTPKHSECFEIQNFTDSARLIDAVNRPTAVSGIPAKLILVILKHYLLVLTRQQTPILLRYKPSTKNKS